MAYINVSQIIFSNMKKVIKIEIEIDDEYVKKWNEDFLSYHTDLYKNEEKAQKALEENPLEKSIGSAIEDYLDNYQEGLLYCNSYIEESNNI